jgi:hypothetical protein
MQPAQNSWKGDEMTKNKEIRVTIAEYQMAADYGYGVSKAVYLSRGHLDSSFIQKDLGCDYLDTRSAVANEADLRGVDLKKWKSGFVRVR